MPSSDGLFVVDYRSTGRPVGIEITAPQSVSLGRLNQLLADLGESPIAEQVNAILPGDQAATVWWLGELLGAQCFDGRNPRRAQRRKQ